ncbi:MAG: T9SS type A sorting domain-containing protein [Bacteroidota bacterium]|nr:T9SS type A sorting domain-containing protein [Bacteroidota bacterium]
MKRLVPVLLFVLLLGVSANAQALFTETFDYNDGALTITTPYLNATSSHYPVAEDNVSGGLWVNNSTSTFDDPLLVESGALTYSGYSLSGVGKKLFCTNLASNSSNNRGYRNFSSAQTGKVYYSMMIKIQTLTGMGGGNYIIALCAASSTSSGSLRGFLYIGNGTIPGTNFKIGIAGPSTTTKYYSSLDLDPANTYLVVVCYDRTVSQATLWINPDLSGPEPVSFDAQTPAGAADALSAIGDIIIYQKAVYPKIYLGGIKVASTWGDAPLPVELTSFTASAKNSSVELKWNTATETNNAGFAIERKASDNGQLTMNNWNKVGFVEGHGTSNAPQSYSYVDANATGKVSYRLKQIDRDGKFTYSSVVEATVTVPDAYTLIQNYPNPFNPTTNIRYQIAKEGFVKLSIFDILGREVAMLVNGVQSKGLHTSSFNASLLNSGVYFYKLETAEFTKTMKMMLVK